MLGSFGEILIIFILVNIMKADITSDMDSKCVSPVQPVWMFDTQTLTCVERMGCPCNTRSNRFPTHAQCRVTCKELIDLHMRVYMTNLNTTRSDRDEHLHSERLRDEQHADAVLSRRGNVEDMSGVEWETGEGAGGVGEWSGNGRDNSVDPEVRSNYGELDPVQSEYVTIDIDSFNF